MIVVLPMAGRGSRFEGSGYLRPKPLILVNGIPMFIKSLESIRGMCYSKLIVVALKEHEEMFNIGGYLSRYGISNIVLLLLDQVTEGQLCTVLAAKEWIDTEEDLLIMGSDTIVKSNMYRDIVQKIPICQGIISVADMPGDRWSFALTDTQGKVLRVAEKQRISSYAGTGMYHFTNGRHFVRHSEQMMRNNETTRGEYYVMPLYQRMIDNGEYITISKATAMWDMGTPDALNKYLNRS